MLKNYYTVTFVLLLNLRKVIIGCPIYIRTFVTTYKGKNTLQSKGPRLENGYIDKAICWDIMSFYNILNNI